MIPSARNALHFYKTVRRECGSQWVLQCEQCRPPGCNDSGKIIGGTEEKKRKSPSGRKKGEEGQDHGFGLVADGPDEQLFEVEKHRGERRRRHPNTARIELGGKVITCGRADIGEKPNKKQKKMRKKEFLERKERMNLGRGGHIKCLKDTQLSWGVVNLYSEQQEIKKTSGLEKREMGGVIWGTQNTLRMNFHHWEGDTKRQGEYGKV